MDSDSFSNASFSKDFGKKKRANRLAKLKQCKLDVRREQWLSQIKDKGCNDDTNVGGDISSMQKAKEGNNTYDCFRSRSQDGENEGFRYHDNDFGTLINDPNSNNLCNKDSNKFFGGNNRRTRSNSCGSVCDDEHEECIDDWEAVADALDVDNSNNKSTHVRLADMEPTSKIAGEHLSDKETTTILMNPQAWMPGDSCRPQSLPSLSNQHNPSGWHHGVVAWSWQDIMPQPLSCPICCEDLDITDTNFLPCSCGFRLCLFCHKRILEADGRCPGCRKQYDHRVNRKMCFSSGTTPFRVVTYCGMISRS